MSDKHRPMFVLTHEEKKMIIVLTTMFVIGLATKHYRETHRPELPPTATGQNVTSARAPDSPPRKGNQSKQPARGK